MLEEIPEFNVEILSMGRDAVFESRELRKQYGLMTNDSLNLYSMNSRGLKIIATNDSDFDRIKGINVWKPSLMR